MAGPTGTRVLALPPTTVLERSVATLEDIAATVGPDAVWLFGYAREPTAAARARHVMGVPVIHPPLETADSGALPRHRIGDELEFVVAQHPRALGAVAGADSGANAGAIAGAERAADVGNSAGGGDSDSDGDGDGADNGSKTQPTSADALICDQITTTTRPTALETTLDHAGELAAALPSGQETSVLTGGLPAGYDERWHLDAGTGAVRTVAHDPLLTAESVADDAVAVRVRGAGPVDGYGGAKSVVALEYSADGTLSSTAYAPGDFGLEAVTGVGQKTANRLESQGVTTRAELLDVSVAALADIEGIGAKSARRMHDHARVLESGEPRRLTDEPLPGEAWGRPPLCLDIETDGLSPTIIWQIGVYDPESDTHRAFVERDDPTDGASVVREFCDWLLGVHPNRALLTWNGRGFDYRHLDAFVARHCPEYVDDWESIPKFDLYRWATDREDTGNALLPGRTNELDVVAAELGYEGLGTGLDGARTAAAYQRFMRTGESAVLEWDRHEAYCEDDCRALWHVYERLRNAPRASGVGSAAGSSPTRDDSRDDSTGGSTSKQTGLGDF
ncbi:ribonuclease H domain protein [Natrialba magadii ATCC 43099]|uniref:Ribonuclease H domain protein n=1 Tax=Natrialba magadii (strain ATCC 43099 / DSM 3394 / CCM 3739 / CIP 104546 / IAM 13178 / JCM 8861 / NBRC 102185 / NCIMB 2190 / MS3) TaxID=547559 RepID=D3SQY0_NATMM|nr:ribonuclease H-like domain-containing protein [Natrialba magadii]ADD06536.1 ribonuclease H domain protein [Natrialba magadii ATCC 43099]ELY32001.1 hypothetical protein C500_05468 [Natrialba magadii ATCC 43099]